MKELIPLLKKQIFTDIYGQTETKDQLKSSLASERHVVIVGPPGIGKTTLIKSLAKSLPEIDVNVCGYNCLPDQPACPLCKSETQKTKKIKGVDRFIRIQGSPELTVEDLLGDIDPIRALKYGPMSIEAFTPGKIFKANNGILFFDELNRCPEKVQNALLQVLEEGIATIGSYEVDIPANFIFIATMNPKDINTERLSDVLLDRFDMIEMQYPETDDIEYKILTNKGKKLDIHFPENLINFIVQFVRDLRHNPNLELVPSVRASLGLFERAQANGVLADCPEVTYKHIQAAMKSVLAHRIKLKPSVEYLKTPTEFVHEALKEFMENIGLDLDKEGGCL